MKVGVVALQGAFREHRELLEGLGVDTVEVRTPAALDPLDALILPGGESTTIGKLLVSSGLLPALAARLDAGLSVLRTFAGALLLATAVLDGRPGQPCLHALHATWPRNVYGPRVPSFTAPSNAASTGRAP